MAKRKYKKRKKEREIQVNPELEGFDIKINSFGEIQSKYDVDEINKFLNKNLKDKKLNKEQIENKPEKGKNKNNE